MRFSGISHSHFSASHADPVRAAEEDIRRYLVRRGVIAPRQPRPARPSLCFLAIYAAIGLIVFLGSLWLARMECDPMFMDRGLTAACRNRAGAFTRIVGPAGNNIPGFMPSTILQ
jgi:hypothetical protein